ncbi:unnamed protein product [Bursaphelenchus okinawaensis]|uniref:Uncharacterized protein n=1 Tax=Bursaphelenchus okinawaensis TaxID=465554 RepID=A0A811LKK3_9BILA|nr:unnamed protein product [Bursaphelenchus okinawaensis]CAG9123459.1 unnamed protein product [Bursaphelenchus okinawaensis]
MEDLTLQAKPTWLFGLPFENKDDDVDYEFISLPVLLLLQLIFFVVLILFVTLKVGITIHRRRMLRSMNQKIDKENFRLLDHAHSIDRRTVIIKQLMVKQIKAYTHGNRQKLTNHRNHFANVYSYEVIANAQ